MENELILTVNVACTEAYYVEGHRRNIAMIPFTGTAEGPYFTGRVMGTGTDTQKISKSGECMLSARYMLEGTDCAGKACKVFIENESTEGGKLRPSIVTDSDALADWENFELLSEIEPVENGVKVRIYKN